MRVLLTGADVVAEHGVLRGGWVLVEEGRISAVGAPGTAPTATSPTPASPTPADRDGSEGVEVVEVAGWLAPGLVDMHAHGGGGASFQTGDPEQVRTVVAHHLASGTTDMAASLVTSGLTDLERALARLREAHADGLVAGVHLEGPFLAASRCGAHDPALLLDPDPDSVRRLLDAGGDALRMVTLAPELPGGLDAVRRIAGEGVVAAVGHTDADHGTTRAAVDAGATVATHLFNAMPPLHHRLPGPVAALLEDERVVVEVIGDGQHVHPSVVRLVARVAGHRRLAWVSDAMAAAGRADGCYRLAGLDVVVRDGIATLAGPGVDRTRPPVLAGSTITVADALRLAVTAGVDPEAAIRSATATPARALGIAHRAGTIAPGRAADLVLLDRDLAVSRVMKDGAWVTPRR